MKFQLKGIVRGAYSEYTEFGGIYGSSSPVLKLEGNSLDEVVTGLALPEWIYILYVNGKRIVDPVRYLKRKGLWNQCIREVVA